MRTKQTGRKAEASELPSKKKMTKREVRDLVLMDDIKYTICEILDGIDSGCSFATYGSYSEAPLPDLHLRGYGPLPLPLTKRDVDTICKERTEGDNDVAAQVMKPVHGLSGPQSQWETKSGNILMRNPAWNGFVQKIAGKAARDLGTKKDAGAVDAKLVKARFWKAGARIPPHKEITNAVNSFGKLLICLPATHRGGSLLFSYDGKTKIFTTETTSRWGYSYIAWYSDVSLELKPLELGHMSMLEYDLVLPSLAGVYSEKEKLRDQLAAWNSAVTKKCPSNYNSFPTLLAHVCDSTYDAESLSYAVLQGNDRFRAACLREVCAALHIGLYIADLDRTLTGFCEDYQDDGNWYMSLEDEDSIVLTKIVDLVGNTVGSDLPLEVEDNFVASDPFADDVPDKEDFTHYDEEDFSHYDGVVTYYYWKTVLVMIPSVAKSEWLSIEDPEERPNKRKRTT